MGGCQNYGPFLDPHYNTAPNIYGNHNGIIILTSIQTEIHLRFLHVSYGLNFLEGGLYRGVLKGY